MRLEYHRGMSIPYVGTGRTAQKARTQRALVEAARKLLAEGPPPTVEQQGRRRDLTDAASATFRKGGVLVAAFPR